MNIRQRPPVPHAATGSLSHATVLSSCLSAVLIGLCGCGASGPTHSIPANPNPAPAESLYIIVPNPAVSSSNASLVARFATDASGTATPYSTLTLPTDVVTESLTTDLSGNIYVAGTAGTPASQIFIYAAGSTGSATPTRTLTPTLPAATGIGSMAVDAAGNLYVASAGSVQIFAPTATGSASPLRTIQWDPTTFIGGQSLAVDGSGSVYVLGYCECSTAGLTNPTEVLVYAPTASGAAAPARTIVSSVAPLDLQTNSIAVDSVGNLFALASLPGASWLNASQIAEFSPAANGNAVPTKTIVGNYGSFGVGPTHLQIDASDNILAFVQYENVDLPQSPILASPLVAAFSPTAAGSVTPTSQFTASLIDSGAYGFSLQ